MKISLKAIDHVHFAVKSIAATEKIFLDWGFKKLSTSKTDDANHAYYNQGKIRIVSSEGTSPKSEYSQFVTKHGDGICDIALTVDDVDATFNELVKRGAKAHQSPLRTTVRNGEITMASVHTAGDVLHSLVARKATQQFLPYIDTDMSISHEGHGMYVVDHLTCNVPQGEMEKWAAFYEKVFDFKETRFFEISTGRTGLLSKVMESEDGSVKIPVNEPTESKSQIQEYLDVNHGPGVQHLAFSCREILKTLPKLRETGQEFLNVPDTYYEEVPKRVKGINESLKEIQNQRVLCDGDQTGYLLQIFSQNIMGGFFIEVIQRCGNRGFGEGNFKALFQAIERDQEKRGVL